MSDFIRFKTAIRERFELMAKGELFVVGVDKDLLWKTYLESFPDGTNPIFRERSEYDCQCCKQFIRAAGNVVSIVDNKLVSIWDIDVGGHYQVVADALSSLVKSRTVVDSFFHREKHLGTDFNHQLLDNSKSPMRWDHFHFMLPPKFINSDAGTSLSAIRSNKEVFKRSLDEISIEAADTVLELIEQQSIYRGEEHKGLVELFIKYKKEYDDLPKDQLDNYCWAQSKLIGPAAKIKNTVIGSLLADISEGMELDKAVKSFEVKVAPTNYKRPTALITKSMVANAQKKVVELGIADSLQRRFAVTDDITVNNVLFADRSVKKAISAFENVFDEMADEMPDNIGKLKKVDAVGIDIFIKDILPKAESIELMFENRHSGNLMSLIAPIAPGAKHIFKWPNNYSWAYNGEVADSMKQRVKSAGGKVDGVLRFSIQWNDGDNNQNDFDAHCIEPNKNLIHYPKQGQVQSSSGVLDVDIVEPGNKVAVENITWSSLSKMLEGEYKFLVHNYSHNGGMTGFSAEIEYDGVIHSYSYNKGLRNNEKVEVASIKFNKETGIEFIKSLPSNQSTKTVWGISTQKFQKVSMIMTSPNHWDGRAVGNKHLFFILEGCKNDKRARGFFNEFLNEDLREHRKVFEVLGSKLKAEESDDQLSGLGFSSTQKNSVYCKVTGAFTRTLKINF
jgi:hypothetical protein